ncbi:hypothetical protein [Mesobacillus jeotgali]|uniref:Uncharacterized protein n=1 Tax=Mesobacillus jeotgali TaxID=129985 RepID=A0ABY9VGA9_9BACI|nr:hypothetical protein [Mesobacillus jeotgali]WNF22976.1 hypothetical protein RH061_23000 [Mesobacillus jeotgali]
MKDFLSSLLFILSILIFAITAYLLFWTIMMPGWFVLPFLISLIIGIITFWSSKKLGSQEKSKHAGK